MNTTDSRLVPPTGPPASSGSDGGKPPWLRVKAPQRERIGAVADLLLDLKLNTVCQEASCPNIGECFAGGTATFLIMGRAAPGPAPIATSISIAV